MSLLTFGTFGGFTAGAWTEVVPRLHVLDDRDGWDWIWSLWCFHLSYSLYLLVVA